MVKTLGTIARPELVTARSSMARRMWLAISTGCTAERRCLAKVPWTARSSPASRRSNSPIGAPPPRGSGRQRSRKTIRRGWAIPERRGPYRGRMNDAVQVIVPRQVPLGGPRSMTVRRTLPARERSFVGAWCFVDHYGPDDVSATGGMDVAPHPHCGLATVSWLFSGEVEHRDSLGTVALVRPGRGQPDDRRSRHLALGGVDALDDRAARCPAVGGAADGGRRTSSRASSTTCPRSWRWPRGCGPRCSWVPCSGRCPRCASRPRWWEPRWCSAGGASVLLPVPDGFEVAVLVDTGSVTIGDTGLARGELGWWGRHGIREGCR